MTSVPSLHASVCVSILPSVTLFLTISALQFFVVFFNFFYTNLWFLGKSSKLCYKLSFSKISSERFIIIIFGPPGTGRVHSNFWKTAHQFFLIFCMKLKGHKGRKLTELDFFRKFLFGRQGGQKVKIGPNFGQNLVKIWKYLKNASLDFFYFLYDFCILYGGQVGQKVKIRRKISFLSKNATFY